MNDAKPKMASGGPGSATLAGALVVLSLLIFAGCRTPPPPEAPNPAPVEQPGASAEESDDPSDTLVAAPRVQIDAKSIRVGDDEIVILDDLGRVPAGETATPGDLLIPALAESLPDRPGSAQAPSRLVVSAAATTPFSTFTKVLYSASSAGWQNPTFELSRKASGSESAVRVNSMASAIAPSANAGRGEVTFGQPAASPRPCTPPPV